MSGIYIHAIQYQINILHPAELHCAVAGESSDDLLSSCFVGYELQRVFFCVVEEVIDVALGNFFAEQRCRQSDRSYFERPAFAEECSFAHLAACQEALEGLVIYADNREVVIHIIGIIKDDFVRLDTYLAIFGSIHSVIALAELSEETVHCLLRNLCRVFRLASVLFCRLVVSVASRENKAQN